MPIYEYKCPVCGYQNEVFRKYDNTDPVWCYICLYKKHQVTLMKKIYSQFSARFIGEGFHVNDYRKNDGTSTD